ncbi:MAG: hypothetical protein F9K44_13285 [Hyphomicrobiaceae bacterium]|nr:MAG: hypothetical protein F9K44_13285 [Hyphomicrobiaceae bacterium]
MAQLWSKRSLLHVGLPTAVALGLGFAAAGGLLLLASPHAALDATAVSHAASRIIDADETLAQELSSWQDPAIVKVAADPRGLLETLVHGDRLTITTTGGQTLVLKLRDANARPDNPATEILLCHADNTSAGAKPEAEPVCITFDLVSPLPPKTTQKAL